MRNRRVVTLALLGVIGLTGACNGSNAGAGDTSTTAKGGAEAGKKVTVSIFQFVPRDLKLSVGDKVTWTNDDNILHTVTSGTRTYAPGDSGKVTATAKDGMFDMPLDGKGKSGDFTFTMAGAFHYFCDRHPGMEADVSVQ